LREPEDNIVLAVKFLKEIVQTAGSKQVVKDRIRINKIDHEDPRIRLVLDVCKIINDTFSKFEQKRRTNFINYMTSDTPHTVRGELTDYYKFKLDADIRSFYKLMRKGGYCIGK
jgi:hypothetical protein